MTDSTLDDALTKRGRSLRDRGYVHESSGNLSVCIDDELIITPTDTSLGRLDPARLSRISTDGRLTDGVPASKKLFLYLAVYKQRLGARAIVHLHCAHRMTWSTAPKSSRRPPACCDCFADRTWRHRRPRKLPISNVIFQVEGRSCMQ
jgi:ribulose-5-phosphate 4-epimerase/fuculose-1-phosphate aldolase